MKFYKIPLNLALIINGQSFERNGCTIEIECVNEQVDGTFLLSEDIASKINHVDFTGLELIEQSEIKCKISDGGLH